MTLYSDRNKHGSLTKMYLNFGHISRNIMVYSVSDISKYLMKTKVLNEKKSQQKDPGFRNV